MGFFEFRPGAEAHPSVRMYRSLDEWQWLPPREVEARTVEGLNHLLVHAAAHVPYYRGTLGTKRSSIASLDDFRRLPILSRRTYRERWDEFHAAQLPDGMVATDYVNTSGTSGIPVRVRQTNVVAASWLAFYLRDLEWTGVDPRRTLAAIRYTVEGPGKASLDPSWDSQLASVVETGKSLTCDIHEDLEWQLALLDRTEPAYLLSYPSNLVALARLLASRDQRLSSLRTIKSISEEISEDSQRFVETTFGVPLRNTYSCFEAGYLATQCPQGDGLHIHAENVHLEIVDDEGHPLPAGQAGRVLVTTLRNYATPLIRYDIDDRAALLGACPCGRGLPLLARPEGKVYPFFELPDGSRKNVMGLAVAMRKAGGFHQFQIEQTSADAVIVRIVPDNSWNADGFVRIERVIADFFGTGMRVQIETLQRIVPGAGGKVRSFLANLPL